MPAAPRTSSLAALHVLLVDDEQGFVDVLAKRLRRRDVAVTSVLSGKEGVRALRGRSFDVAVLDLKMEDLDGIEVLKIFKILDPAMPVIILTGHGSEQAAREGLALGAADYLMKPCDLDELLNKIGALAPLSGAQAA
ncbi:response regulator [Desulfonatronum sp. SC1]|uniref:response regulator n=1 Tax=Desulfonatronum sp. SC1 TaxID=2109626 RepID=UPI000D31A861|nr:response regulator [Desulfonatronum sp. SC1]PTN33155.1 response regulator [Desulfonatronum sp. SC1]